MTKWSMSGVLLCICIYIYMCIHIHIDLLSEYSYLEVLVSECAHQQKKCVQYLRNFDPCWDIFRWCLIQVTIPTSLSARLSWIRIDIRVWRQEHILSIITAIKTCVLSICEIEINTMTIFFSKKAVTLAESWRASPLSSSFFCLPLSFACSFATPYTPARG